MNEVPPNTSAPVSYAWWRAVFDAAEDAQLICNTAAEICQCNRRAAQWLGTDASGTPPIRLLDAILTPSTHEKLQGILARPLFRNETIPSVPLVLDGQITGLVDLQITPLSDGFALVTLKDASRRWRLESHAQRLTAAIDATVDVVFLADAQCRLNFVNAAFQTATGFTIEDALGQTAEFLRAPGQEALLQQAMAAVRKGKDWQGELTNVRSDGSTYTVEASISPIYDRQGAFLGYVAFERDTTQKRRLQDAVLQERNFAVSVLNSLDAAVYSIDLEFKLTHVNDGWRRMPASHGLLTFGEEPRVGHSLLDYVPDRAKRAELRQLFQLVLDQGEAQELGGVQDGGSHWHIKVSPRRHEGNIVGLLYVVSDRTKLHNLERQLYQAQKMETIGALAAGVAHDFNNLLQAIRGNVALMLLQEQLPATLRHSVDQIDRAAEQAADITQQLLTFSRATDDAETVVDLNEILTESSKLARRSLVSKVAVQVVPTQQPVKVRLHATQAQQCLLNLCINAQDAMPNGGTIVLQNEIVTLTSEQLARAPRSSGKAFVRCSVRDSGTGIPQEILSRIFDPFFTTKGPGKGTGLGLSICHGIVSRAGGFIEVESIPNQGTTFLLYFPLADGAVTAVPPMARTQIARGSGRVLVVDDLDLVRELVETFLRAAGYEVLSANSAEAAIEVLEGEDVPPDLIFTDYNMGGASGEQLIRDVAARWPGIKFILASGYLEGKDRTELEQTYGARILHKPFNIRDAANLIAELLP